MVKGCTIRHIFIVLACSALISACSDASPESQAHSVISQTDPANDGPQNEFGFYETMSSGPDLFGNDHEVAAGRTVDIIEAEPSPSQREIVSEGSGSSQQAASQQIAYSYGLGYQIDSDDIAELQNTHIALCDAAGPECRILKTSIANSADWDGYGEVQLEIAGDKAGAFQTLLTESSEDLGGELISAVRDGEDLSDTIIDAEARLQSRLILRDKLTAILQNRGGSVDELVKAEQALANVNEEIDAARSKLTQYRDRIQYSAVSIEYKPYYGSNQIGFSRPIATAWNSIGTTLGSTIAVLIYALTALVPIAILILALRWLLHRFGMRFRFWRKNLPNTRREKNEDSPLV